MQTLLNLDYIPTAAAPGEAAANAAASRGAYAARLAAALGDGRLWEYRDECHDLGAPTGRCACGHTGLRFLFTLHHTETNQTVAVGSSCIVSYPGITPEAAARLQADAARMDAAIAEAKRNAREKARDEAITGLLERWSAAEWQADERAAAWIGQYAPAEAYTRGPYRASYRLRDRTPDQPHPRVRLPVLKSRAGIVRRLEREAAKAERVRDSIPMPLVRID
jgi:hypothetical protein